MTTDPLSNSLWTQLVEYAAKTTSSQSQATTSSATQGTSIQDTSSVSDIASYLEKLQQLQESDPTAFKKAAAEIAQRLNDKAKDASDSGDTQSAKILSDLAGKFQEASTTGQMPDLRAPMGPPPQMASQTGADSGSSAGASSSATGSSQQQLMARFSQGAPDPLATLAAVLSGVLSTSQTSG